MSRKIYKSLAIEPISYPEDTIGDYIRKFGQCDFKYHDLVVPFRSYTDRENGCNITYWHTKSPGFIDRICRIVKVDQGRLRVEKPDGATTWFPWFCVRKRGKPND